MIRRIFGVVILVAGLVVAAEPIYDVPRDARLKLEQAQKLAIAEAKRHKVPEARMSEPPSLHFFRDDGDIWWVFHFAPKNPGPGEWSQVLVSDRTKRVRFMGGM